MRRALLAAALAALACLAVAAPASAAFELTEADVEFTDQNGKPVTQAGSHPFAMTTTVGVSTEATSEGKVPEGELRYLTIAQIPGFIGNQTAVPTCTEAEFNTRDEGRTSCPDSTAVGIAAVEAEFEVIPPSEAGLLYHVPVYNLEPPPGVPARLGFVVLNVPVVVDVRVSEAPPYNLVAKLVETPQAILFYRSELTLWGNPASPLHDPLRGQCAGELFVPTAEPVSLGTCKTTVSEKAFLTLPRACEGPLLTLFDAVSWLGDLSEKEALTHVGAEPRGMTGCATLSLAPDVSVRPTTSSGESPSGIDVDLEVNDPGLTNPTGEAQSDIKKVTVTFPPGVTANPSAASGLGVCTKAQYEAARLDVAGCPESSKLGTVQIKTPLLAEPVAGEVFLAQPDDPSTQQHGAENPFDSLLAVYLLIRSPQYGVFIRQAGEVEPDPRTGQLVSTFDEIPQLPFSKLNFHLREGPRAPLVTPPLCGTYTTRARFTPWANPDQAVESSSTFKVTSGSGGGSCPNGGVPPFAPGFEAGSTNNNAGSYSPFYMRLTRHDGEQNMTRFDSVLPRGVIGKIAGVAKCSDQALAGAKAKTGRQEIAAPSCPADSQIGRVLVGAGVGSSLTYVPGKIYLAGPFGGDPLSVAVVTSAVAGPFDVGTVVTREALTINPETAEVEVDGAASEPIPTILRGIPLKLRDLRVYIDRENFTLNPTSCEPKTAHATLFGSGADLFSSTDDVPAALSVRYQAANCANLGFKPGLTLQLKGATKRGGFPRLRSVVTFPKKGRYANIGRAAVTLPHSEFISPLRISNSCTRPAFAEGKCPPATRLGYARAWTPLLDEPLEGPVYFRSNGGAREIPDIVADLKGVVDIVLVGAVDSVGPHNKAQLRTTFAQVPDAPVSRFELTLKGGKQGVIENSQNLCFGKRRVKVSMRGQNGRLHSFMTPLLTSCKQKGKRGKRHSRHR